MLLSGGGILSSGMQSPRLRGRRTFAPSTGSSAIPTARHNGPPGRCNGLSWRRSLSRPSEAPRLLLPVSRAGLGYGRGTEPSPGNLPHGYIYTSQSTHARQVEKQGMPKPDGNRLGCEASIDPQKPRELRVTASRGYLWRGSGRLRCPGSCSDQQL